MKTSISGQVQGWATLKEELYTISTLQLSHKNASLFHLDESWQLTNLLYHVSRVDYHFHLAIKIDWLQLKNTHIYNILFLACIFLGLPHMLTS